MFTGIIRDVGRIAAINRKEGEDPVFTIETALDTAKWDIGASICCSGVCLTVIAKDTGRFDVQLSPETMERTTASAWQVGTPVNLEESLKMGDELGGHLVSGHVDGMGRVEKVMPDGGSHRFIFSVPVELAPFIAQKGSVAINGVSLTVNAVDNVRFSINIIPHTWDVTTFGQLKAGDAVNVEVDLFARYIARQLDMRQISEK